MLKIAISLQNKVSFEVVLGSMLRPPQHMKGKFATKTIRLKKAFFVYNGHCFLTIEQCGRVEHYTHRRRSLTFVPHTASHIM